MIALSQAQARCVSQGVEAEDVSLNGIGHERTPQEAAAVAEAQITLGRLPKWKILKILALPKQTARRAEQRAPALTFALPTNFCAHTLARMSENMQRISAAFRRSGDPILTLLSASIDETYLEKKFEADYVEQDDGSEDMFAVGGRWSRDPALNRAMMTFDQADVEPFSSQAPLVLDLILRRADDWDALALASYPVLRGDSNKDLAMDIFIRVLETSSMSSNSCVVTYSFDGYAGWRSVDRLLQGRGQMPSFDAFPFVQNMRMLPPAALPT